MKVILVYDENGQILDPMSYSPEIVKIPEGKTAQETFELWCKAESGVEYMEREVKNVD